ncbi:MAG: hypothetical protein LBG60_14150, partial [Bifidobacteriaceae bacterium]|nr:hypothetical protein [Bifidobacteriaceae bacterium]
MIRLVAGLAAIGVLALAGCGHEPKPIGPDEAAQAAAADEFADCLRQADLPVFVSTSPDGQKDVHVEGDEVVAISTSFDSGISGGDYSSEAAQKAALAAAGELVKAYDPVQGAMMTGASEKELDALGGATDPEARYLIVGTTDQTEPYFECLDRTGYEPSTYSGDPADELKAKQRVAQATVKWAECARQNGYPDLKDPDAPTTGDDSWPAAVLPGDITTAELNRLLDSCPNYDVEGQLAFHE